MHKHNKTHEQSLEDQLTAARISRKLLGAKQYKYEDDKLKILALDVRIGNLLLQMEKI